MKQKNKIPLPAVKILNVLISEKRKGILEIRPRDINPKEIFMNDRIWNYGIDWLMKFNFVKKRIVKKNEVYYSLNPKYLQEAFKVGRRNSDALELQSFPFKDVINLTAIRSKTTIYGLSEEIFHKSDFKNRTFDYSQKETLDFVGGIKPIDIFGKYLGVPLTVKYRCGSKISEKEIVEKEIEYYLDLLKNGRDIFIKDEKKIKSNKKVKSKISNIKNFNQKFKIEDVIKMIIIAHRNKKIQFNKLGENISDYLIELKREYRRKIILESYNIRLKRLSMGKLKSNLARLKQGFIGILAQTDYDKDFLRKSIFEFYGEGVGGYDYNKNPKLFWSFHKFVNSLRPKEKEILFNFLWGIFEEHRYLYPTNVAFICRGHSVDYLPEGTEKII